MSFTFLVFLDMRQKIGQKSMFLQEMFAHTARKQYLCSVFKRQAINKY